MSPRLLVYGLLPPLAKPASVLWRASKMAAAKRKRGDGPGPKKKRAKKAPKEAKEKEPPSGANAGSEEHQVPPPVSQVRTDCRVGFGNGGGVPLSVCKGRFLRDILYGGAVVLTRYFLEAFLFVLV